jgi:hypothetical protein
MSPETDSEVEELRDRLYALAEIIIDGYAKRRDAGKESGTDLVTTGLAHSSIELTQDVCLAPVLHN